MLAKNYKHLCILYPGGCGGNHLVNLIGTVDGFEGTTLANKDFGLLKNYYNRYLAYPSWYKVHFHKINHMIQLRTGYTEHLKYLNNNPLKNVLFGHWAAFETNIKTNSFVNLDDCVWVVITWPSEDSFAMKRMIKNNMLPQIRTKYNLGVKIQIDDSDPDSVITLADETNGFLLDVEQYFSNDGWSYVNSLLQQKLGLTLPAPTEELHQIWLSGIKKDIL